jgi:L-ascorbate metabolism protein UlaG (beta-lactamase superfamily)
MQRKNNPALKTIKKDYEGNMLRYNRFRNQYVTPFTVSLRKAFIKSFQKRKTKKILRKENHTIPVLHLQSLPSRNKDSIVWLGHASFLLTLQKKRILIDPHLSSHFYLKRKTIIPAGAELLKTIDYLCISHAHRDHLDKATIKKIKGNKKAQALVPLGVGKYIQKSNTSFFIQEAGWFQQYQTTANLNIFLLPAKHWSMRFPWDMNKSLWGSFLFQTKNKTIFFCGDSAYTDHFKEIHQLFPRIDISIMPIGAYEPADIMLPNHMSPAQSVKAFSQLKAKTFIPMHYGTFELSDDSSEISLQLLRAEMTKQKLGKKLIIPAVGEVIYL